ncbi:hypothetical protein Aduo_015810 [Ancylostoma duodenale]
MPIKDRDFLEYSHSVINNEAIQNLLIAASIAKTVLDTPKEDYLKEVKELFQYCFDTDNSENEELFSRLEQSDREEFLEIQKQCQAKEAELGLKDD